MFARSDSVKSTGKAPSAEVEAKASDAIDAALDSIPARSSNFKAVSWNVNGLRSLLKYPSLLDKYLEKESPDILFLNETKVDDSITAKFDSVATGYTAHWNCCTVKKGYSGTAVFVKDGVETVGVQNGIGVKEHDGEGRAITVELKDVFLVGTYVPNSGMKLDRLDYRTTEWDVALLAYLDGLKKKKKAVVWMGDLNVAHLDIDCHNPKSNFNKTPGFTKAERDNMSLVLTSGWADVWRERHPEDEGYTYWSYRFGARAKNKGWRLDYAIVNEEARGMVADVFTRRTVFGSDHVPVGIELTGV